MRILYILPGTILGGAEIKAFRFSILLTSTGHDVHIVSGQRPNLDNLPESYIKFYILPFLKSKLNILTFFLSMPYLFFYIKRNHIQLVITSKRSVAFWVSCIKTILNIKHIYLHVNVFNDILRSWCLSDYIIAISRACLENVLIQLKPDPQKTCMIYRGVDIPNDVIDRVKSRKKFYIEDDIIVIGYSGRLAEEKGVGILMRAFARLALAQKHLLLVIMGQGPQKRTLEKLANTLNCSSQVRFVGWLTNVWDILPALDIFVNPSIKAEGLSNSLLEAAACGLPLIGTAVGGIPEVVKDGINGIVVPQHDVNALERALMRLISNKDERILMGKASHTIAIEQFSFNGEFKRHLEVYEKVLANKL